MNAKFMREAIRLSLKNLRHNSGGPFGAVIVRKGRIISRGWNCVTSSHDPTAHAEVLAIRKACRRLKRFHLDDCKLYTSCEPCPLCLAAAYWARIGTIYFGNGRQDAAAIDFNDDLIYRELALPREKRRIQMRQLLRREAQAAFRAWTAKTDRIPY